MPPEFWSPIPGYEGFYDVSSLGRVRRIAGGKGAIKGAILTPVFHKKTGYLYVGLYRNKVYKQHSIHALVCRTFNGQPCPGQEVNHLNGVKVDNQADNLQWCTRTENVAHAIKSGLKSRFERSPECRQKLSVMAKARYKTNPDLALNGSRNPQAKLTEADVAYIRLQLSLGTRAARIAEAYNISQATVCNIKTGKRWNHFKS